MSAMMISQVQIHDPALFQDYLAKSKDIAGRYGAELLARGRLEMVFNGNDKPAPLVVIARFPSLEKLNAWFEDDDYKAIIGLRDKSSHQEMTAWTLIED